MLDNNATMQIQSVASQATVAIVFVNADSGEGYIQVDGNLGDRNNLTSWQGGDLLIQQVASLCNNTVVVVHSTGPVLMPWSTNENITAIVWAGVPGEQAGNSIVDILYGAVNPAGRLPFTIGADRQDYGTSVLYQPNNGYGPPQLDFKEGVFIDYRAFDLKNIKPTCKCQLFSCFFLVRLPAWTILSPRNSLKALHFALQQFLNTKTSHVPHSVVAFADDILQTNSDLGYHTQPFPTPTSRSSPMVTLLTTRLSV